MSDLLSPKAQSLKASSELILADGGSRGASTRGLAMWSQQAAQWGELYSAHCSLGAPCFVVDPQSGVVGQLTLDLHAIARSSIRRVKLAP